MYDDHSDLPMPLSIVLDRLRDSDGRMVRDPASGVPAFEATCPLFPGLSGVSGRPGGAVRDLIESILDVLPLQPGLVAALIGAGYGQEVVNAWSQKMCGRELRHLRSDADQALEVLQTYCDAGVPPVAASTYFALGLDAEMASKIYAAGRPLEETSQYMREVFSQDRYRGVTVMDWLTSDFPAERGRLYLGVSEVPVREARAWEAIVTERGISDADLNHVLRWGISRNSIQSGVPIQRLVTYARSQVAEAEVASWEAAVARHEISDNDLRDVLRARYSLAEVDEYASTYAESGLTVGDAARTLLALAATPSGDPWAIGANQLPLF
ncbi:hypothetical protein H5V45_09280 [Nocardioides sp. KIGAM211]|uniref:Uncharacterized protein n=1 Tax=Nocardioides luti TaxID=2761101 RepID=A0A7X0RI76_9ACTN|nr:hypothetical protein [Nocardioides luti]MBB6627514.1 hypothetical protein [Nocardioides luti]